MFCRSAAPLVCALWICASSLSAQQNATPAGDLYAQIPSLRDSGEKKLQSGDRRGAIDDFTKAFEASRALSQRYPDEPAYRENAYFYQGRLASTFAEANDIPSALQMAEPSARGYAEMAASDATPENKEKAADALGRLALIQVLGQDGAAGEKSAREALALAPESTLIKVNLAHALLLNGTREEALALYKAAAGESASDGRSVRDIILDDFAAMEKTGTPDETIAPMRAALGAAETATARRRKPDPLPLWPFVVLVFGGIGIIFVFFIYFDRKRTAALHAKAKALGFTFRPKPTAEDEQLTAGTHLATVGQSRQIRHVIELPPQDDAQTTLFELSYVVGSGKRTRNYRQTVARFQSRMLNLPAFELRPEAVFLKIAQSFGMQDIDIAESPTFSGMYMLRGEDETAIRRLFTPAVVRYCETNRGLWISGAGDLLWVHREKRRVKPEELGGFVTEARQTFALFADTQRSAAPVPPPLPTV